MFQFILNMKIQLKSYLPKLNVTPQSQSKCQYSLSNLHLIHSYPQPIFRVMQSARSLFPICFVIFNKKKYSFAKLAMNQNHLATQQTAIFEKGTLTKTLKTSKSLLVGRVCTSAQFYLDSIGNVIQDLFSGDAISSIIFSNTLSFLTKKYSLTKLVMNQNLAE